MSIDLKVCGYRLMARIQKNTPTMGATRAEKEVYFTKLKELLAKYRACKTTLADGLIIYRQP